MADYYLVITDERGVVLPGESQTAVYDPYTKSTVARPVEIDSLDGETEQTYAIGSGTGTGGGKVVFDPFTIDKSVDSVSQPTFLAHAMGTVWKFVDLLVVRTVGEPTNPARPFLSYRLGTVGISDIQTTSDGENVRERVSFVFGTLQIGYQAVKPDGTLAAFAPVGWDRIRNIKI